jgi:hypothetical protein
LISKYNVYSFCILSDDVAFPSLLGLSSVFFPLLEPSALYWLEIGKDWESSVGASHRIGPVQNKKLTRFS